MRFLLLSFLFFSSLFSSEKTWVSSSGDISIELSIPNSEISFGNQLNVKAILKFPSHFDLDVNKLISHLLWHSNPISPNWDLLDKKIDVSESTLEKQVIIKATLTPAKKGLLFLSWLGIVFNSKDQKSERVEVFTPIFEINVVEGISIEKNLNANLELIPLEPRYFVTLNEENTQAEFGLSALEQEKRKNIRTLEMRSFPWLFLIICVFGCLGIVFWKLILLEKSQVKASQLTLRDKSLLALEKLKQSKLHEVGKFGEYYQKISMILKSYLDKRLNIPAVSKTTEELVKDPVFLNLPIQMQTKIKSILIKMDEIKFSTIKRPTVEDSQSLYNHIKEIILEI